MSIDHKVRAGALYWGYKGKTHESQFMTYYVDEATAASILTTLTRPDMERVLMAKLDDVLDRWSKHSYWQIDLEHNLHVLHPMTEFGVLGAITMRAGEMNKETMAKNAEKHLGADEWTLGIFSKGVRAENMRKYEEVEAAVKFVISFVMQSIMDRPQVIIQGQGKRTVLERSKGKARFTTIHLSDIGKRYVSGEHGVGGWKMPEHEVRSFERHLKDGRIVQVRAHKRGDPSIARKTTTIVNVRS